MLSRLFPADCSRVAVTALEESIPAGSARSVSSAAGRQGLRWIRERRLDACMQCHPKRRSIVFSCFLEHVRLDEQPRDGELETRQEIRGI